MRGDFSEMLPRLRHNNLSHELLIKAARIRDLEEGRVPVAMDATAGMGQDALLLAAAGFRVELYEQDPVIAALLADALERAAADPALSETVGRMRLHKEDSISAMRALCEMDIISGMCGTHGEDSNCIDIMQTLQDVPAVVRPDVIYLDPMFPERQKNALVKKKFQLLHQLETPCRNEEELLQAALKVHPFKVVVKRPRKGPDLAGMKPGYSIPGKAIRYDCFVFPESRRNQ
ncbi:MAG: class I SAM-dependent methyltransferase [Eubacterium sp.]|nr:class I SAM-dependent methyltransferase [Eubacterium sp.]